jgi:cell wall-associated NlpC family hydrolase
MARLTPEQIYAVALQAGFPPDKAVTFTAIAMAESGGDPSVNAAGTEDSRGLWQINVSPGVRANKWGDLYDPLTNARAAFEVSGGGTKIQPWSVTHDANAGTQRDYRQYLPEAQAAAGAVGATPGAFAAPVVGLAAQPDGGGHAADGVETFVQAALNQVGDRYVYGTDVDLDNPNPTTFDCSELTQWAAHQAGVELGEATYIQYLDLKEHGTALDVDKALQTRGALLFHFSSEPTPGGGRPNEAHVAISLGDGRVVEAANENEGVVVSKAGHRFNYAAAIPGLTGASLDAAPAALMTATLPDPTDSDSDGLTDAFEAMLGTDSHSVDTDQDSLSDLYETTVSHTDALSADTDQDGTSDALEVADGTDAGVQRLPDALVAAGFGGAATADIDQDGLSDLLEQQLGTDRDAPDTDHDGVTDAMEYALGSNPISIDTDLDGITDGVEFDMGTLGPAASAVALPPGSGPLPGDLGLPDGAGLPGHAVPGSSPTAEVVLDPLH